MTPGRSALRERFGARLSLPLIAAPMFRVSGLDLVTACCRAGVIGAFPTANCRTVEVLEQWLAALRERLGPADAPVCPNLIMRRDTLREEIACLARHRVEIAITSVGPPDLAVEPLHAAGCLVLADIATVHHARKAVAAGVDGLILLTAGAGGQTGWANGFAFARAVRAFYDGPIVMAGGISDGVALHAAEVLGCDLAYMGTRFVAARESLADPDYKQMLVDSHLDDVLLTKAFTGLETNMLKPSIARAGIDMAALPADVTRENADALYGSAAAGPRRWQDIWSAGHTVPAVGAVQDVAAIVAAVGEEYAASRGPGA